MIVYPRHRFVPPHISLFLEKDSVIKLLCFEVYFQRAFSQWLFCFLQAWNG